MTASEDLLKRSLAILKSCNCTVGQLPMNIPSTWSGRFQVRSVAEHLGFNCIILIIMIVSHPCPFMMRNSTYSIILNFHPSLASGFPSISIISRLWRVGLFDFGSGSGRVWPKSSGFGFGFGYCAYCGLKAKSLVILCNSISNFKNSRIWGWLKKVWSALQGNSLMGKP